MMILALLLAANASAAAYAPAVDPRFELLGVVSHLAGRGRAEADTAEYRARIDKRFAAFRAHPAVELYKAIAARPFREEASATLLIYYTEPPELRLKDKDADIHYLHDRGAREELQRLIWELRDFARVTGFTSFFRDNAAYYRTVEETARAPLAAVDPVAEIERLLGVSLAASSRYIVSLFARDTHAFIVPYPLPPANAGAASFEAYTVSAAPPAKAFADVWPEPLYVFIDPSFYYFEKLNIPDPVAFYGPDIAACRAVSPECTKSFVVAALIERLNKRTLGRSTPAPGTERDRRYVAALSARLDEYDRDRARYPTLWTFYPRLFSVFHELAHGGRAAKLAVPADVPILAASDYFDPKIFRRLTR